MAEEKKEIWFASYRLLNWIPVHWKGWLVLFVDIGLVVLWIVFCGATGIFQSHPAITAFGAFLIFYGFLLSFQIGRWERR